MPTINRQSLSEAREGARLNAAGGRDRLESNRNYRKSARDNLHYQGEYGTIMTDEGYQAANEEKAAFNTEIASRREQVANARKEVAAEDTRARAELESKRAEQQSAINSGFTLDIPGFSGGGNIDGKIPSYSDYLGDDSNFATINLNGDQNYRVPHDVAGTIINDIHESNKEAPDDIYVGQDGNTVNIYAKNGKEIHEGLNEGERLIKADYEAKSSVARAQVNAAKQQQARAKAAYDSQVRAAQAKAAEMKRQAQYTLDTSYNQGLTDIQGDIFIQTEKLAGIDQTTNMYVQQRNDALQAVRDGYTNQIAEKKETVGALSGQREAITRRKRSDT